MKLTNMGISQWSEVAVAFQKAGFTPELMQQIINCPSNAAAYQMLKAAHETFGGELPLFGCAVNKFRVSAMSTHNSASAVQDLTFYKDQFFSFKDKICKDVLYIKTTDKFRPHGEYNFEIFPVLNTATLDDAAAFLKEKNALFVGVEAFAAMWAFSGLKYLLPKPVGKGMANIISLPHDGLEQKLDDRNVVRVSRINTESGKEWGLDQLNDLELNKSDYLLCVTKNRD